jgi:hypothetical protein
LIREGAEDGAEYLKTARIGVEKATTPVTLAVLRATM